MKRRLILIGGIVALSLCVLLVTAGGRWLDNLVRQRIISAVQNATGGRVAVRAAHFDWRSLTAELDGLTIRGARRETAPPLLTSDSVRLQFRIVSFLKRDIDLASLVIVRPKLDLSLSKSTGIPKIAHLRIHRFELVQGVFQTDFKQIAVTASGGDLNVSVALEAARPRYDITLSARHLHIGSGLFNPLDAAASMTAQLQAGRLTVQHLSLSAGEDKLQAEGMVQSFARPVANFAVFAHVALGGPGSQPVASRLFGTFAPDTGSLDLTANVHYDPQTSLAVNGKLSGRQLAWRVRGVPLKNIAFDSEIAERGGEVRFSNAAVSALGGKISGTAVVRNFRDMNFDGTLSGAPIRAAVLLIAGRPLDWAGAASGKIHFRGAWGAHSPDFALSADVKISPLPGSIPVAGNLQIAYRSRTGVIAFGNSQLNLPRTQASFSGTPRGILQLTIATQDLDDVAPALAFLPALKAVLPAWLEHANVQFAGQIANAAADPQVQGNITVANVTWAGQEWGPVRCRAVLSRGAAELANFSASAGALHAAGTARIALQNWTVQPESNFTLNGRFTGLDLGKAVVHIASKSHITAGTASGSLDLYGSVTNPVGTAQLSARGIVFAGEHLDSADVVAKLDRNRLRIQHARLSAGPAFITLSGGYEHAAAWRDGTLRVRIDSNGFPLGSVLPLRNNVADLAADLRIHGVAAARIVNGNWEPTNADGALIFRDISLNHVRVGSARIDATTSGDSVAAKLAGNIRGARVSGSLQVSVAPGTPARGELHLSRISLSSIAALVRPASADPLPFGGWTEGGVAFDGPLQNPSRMHALVHMDDLQMRANLPSNSGVKASDLAIRNVGALVFEIENGVAKVRSFHLGGSDTGIAVLGSIPCGPNKPMNLTVGGSAGLRIFELFDSNVRASGQSLIEASIRGPFSDPAIEGTLELKNGSFFLNNVANGLTAVNGTVSFDRNRATIQKLTAESGGGKLRLGGFVSFGGGEPLVYNVEASAHDVRIRPGANMSITANGSLRLSGTSDNSMLGGSISISHIVLNANSDLGGLLASFSAPVPSPGNEKDFINGLQFDVRVASEPNLQLSSSLGRDLEAEIDLRLRGTPNQPVLLGTISANQGEVNVFGTKYTINRADVHFVNPVKIEPTLDLDLQTQAHGITVNIAIAGSLNKLNINYRSDPPLQPRDIIALLAVGETPGTAASVVNAPTAAQTSALQSSANSLLGQAMAPESGRLSKLFGITNIKIDPLAQGSTVTPESRLTIQQQISRNITVTYVTNLAQTSEQIFRLEWTLSRQYSVVAVRDDNGEFGIDIQYKKRF